jgi:hypothetical protein
MKNLIHLVTSVLLVTSLAVLSASMVLAQDPVKVAPDIYKVLLENDQVRVLEIRMKPGGKSPMHSHPAFIIYSFTDSKTRFTTPEGKTNEMEIKAGEAAWSEAVTHAVENVGRTQSYVLNIEMKAPPKKVDQSTETMEVVQDPAKVAPKRYKLLLENERVRVLEAWDRPGEKVGMHSHPEHLLYFLTDYRRKIVYPDGKTKVVEGRSGEIRWVPALTHAGENIGSTDTHLLLIEFKDL